MRARKLEGTLHVAGYRTDADALLAAAERSALVTVTHYTAEGSAETAGESTDVVLSRTDGRLHILTRSAGSPDRLVRTGAQGKDAVHDRITGLLGQAPAA